MKNLQNTSSLKFSLGYNNEVNFIDVVSKYYKNIDEVYFSIPGMQSGRPRYIFDQSSLDRLHIFLKKMSQSYSNIKLNLLFNGLCNYEDYNTTQLVMFEKYGNIVRQYCAEYGIKAVTFVSPELCSYIKRVFPFIETHASVNLFISEPKQLAYLSDFDVVILTRDINRNFEKIRQIVNRKSHKVKLLLNEGCMPFCVNRVQCMNSVAAKSCQSTEANSIIYCYPRYNDEPWLCLQSPFIRPEDLMHYKHLGIDYWKIATRIKDSRLIDVMLDAYINEKFVGNYFVFSENLSNFNLHKKYFLDNSLLPTDFFQKVSGCKHNCSSCDYCKTVFEKLVKRL